jgi:hypothetical protein
LGDHSDGTLLKLIDIEASLVWNVHL